MAKRFFTLLLAVCLLAAAVPVSADASTAYYINNAIVRCDDFTSRPNNCRAYAEKMYQKIWGTTFGNSFYAENNFLRNLEKEQLTLTEEHLKEYVSHAELGSTIRVSSEYFLYRNDGRLGHSQIIVQKDANGFTVLEGGLAAYPYYGENYYTWSDYVNAHWLGGRYGYIKYIKWPDAPAYFDGYGDDFPTVSDPVITVNKDLTGFSVSYTASDDREVTGAYVLVWPQGTLKTNASVHPCEFDGTTATVSVTCDTSGIVKNFYVQWCAVDQNGNVGGKDLAPRMVCLYEPTVNCLGRCQIKVADAPVCTAPYMEVNGEETIKYRVSEGGRMSVTGILRNADGQRWYQLTNGLWISEEYVRYDTFHSFIDWLYSSDPNKQIIYMDGQILFIGD